MFARSWSPNTTSSGSYSGQVGHLDRLDLAVQRLHLLAPAGVELVPVLEVVAGALLEEARALGDLVRVGDRVGGDVDVAVDHAVVDAHRRRHGEGAVLPAAERVVGVVDLDHVERRHREREVLRVPEPEPALVGLAAVLVEERLVRVHLLPALAAGRGLDVEGIRELGHRYASLSASPRAIRCAAASIVTIGLTPSPVGRTAPSTT